MLRRERLELKNWWNTLGQWGPITALLERFGKESQPVLHRQITGLVNQLVRDIEKFDVKLFIQRILPIAADGVKAPRFSEGLELASRLAESGVDPSQTLQYGLPILAQNANSDDAFKTNLLYLEALLAHQREKRMDTGKAFFVAVRTVAKELDTRQLTTSLVLATRLAEKGVDPSDMLRFAIPAASIALSDQQLRLAMALANHVVRRDGNVTHLLGHDLPEVAREIAPDQLTTGLRVGIHLEEKRIAASALFKNGLSAIVEASQSPDEFQQEDDYQQNVNMLATLLIKLKQQQMTINPPITAMANGCAQPSDFRDNVEALYRFCQTMRKHKVVPDALLQHGFPPTVSHDPVTFQTTLQNLTTVVVRLREAGVNDHLLAYIIEYGLDRVAKCSATTEDFRQHLITVMKSFRVLAMRDIEKSSHERAFRSIEKSGSHFVSTSELMSAQQLLKGGLAFVYELAANAHFDWRDIRPTRIKEMAVEALAFMENGKQYSVESAKEGPKVVPKTEGQEAFRSRVRGTQAAKKS
jgi:hypothetical protein